MLIIKIGGSVFAPKNNNFFDENYLKKINKILKKNFLGQIILIHGTGNFGHSFVKNFGISKKTFKIFLKRRTNFFRKIDNIFPSYKRILARKICKVGKKILEKNKSNIIISGDILNKSLKIISSDTIFAKFLGMKNSIKIILTDVDGVLDKNGNIIEKLDLKDLEKINFWEKSGDVTNSMKGKLEALAKKLKKQEKVFLCNGKNLENLLNFLENKKAKGTLIIKS